MTTGRLLAAAERNGEMLLAAGILALALIAAMVIHRVNRKGDERLPLGVVLSLVIPLTGWLVLWLWNPPFEWEHSSFLAGIGLAIATAVASGNGLVIWFRWIIAVTIPGSGSDEQP